MMPSPVALSLQFFKQVLGHPRAGSMKSIILLFLLTWLFPTYSSNMTFLSVPDDLQPEEDQQPEKDYQLKKSQSPEEDPQQKKLNNFKNINNFKKIKITEKTINNFFRTTQL